MKDLALKKLVLQKVVASEEDIAKLKADHPTATVQWNQPDETIAAKTKEKFQQFGDKQKKAAP